MLEVFAIILLTLIALFVGATYWVSRPVFNTKREGFSPSIAPLSEALTFARTSNGLFWVTAHNGDSIQGVNLTELYGKTATADLIDFVKSLDQSTLPEPSTAIAVSLEELTNPLDYAFPYIAAGTNFKEHAEEVYSDDPPFLFPKLAKAGGWQDAVSFNKRLDFEAELLMFPLEDITSPDHLPAFGLVLGNDFTDRWKLIRGLSLKKPLGETGFAVGKGQPGYMPTGHLAVIPNSPEFYLSLDVSLYVNDNLRQRFKMRDLILPIEAIVKQAFEKKDVAYERGGDTVSIMPEGKIPRGTLILTGTAAGVIFKPLNIWNQHFYLQSGDVVRTEATCLGHMENIVSKKER